MGGHGCGPPGHPGKEQTGSHGTGSVPLLQDRPSPMPYKEVPEAMAASMLLGAPPEDREWGVGGEERG